jgi:hypothetical protein
MQGTEVTYWQSLISNYPFAPGLSIDLFLPVGGKTKTKINGFCCGPGCVSAACQTKSE